MDERELRQRFDRLEEQVQALEQRWSDDQRRIEARRRRERWMRLGALVLIVVAYLIYLQYITNIPG